MKLTVDAISILYGIDKSATRDGLLEKRMRRKKEAIRIAIIRAALTQFTDQGFDSASMDSVAEQAGCTKATVYNYFDSKEALLLAAMREYARMVADGAFTDLTGSVDTEKTLRRFAVAYLKFQLSPNMVALMRMAVAEGNRGTLAQTVYEDGIRGYWTRVSEYLAARIDAADLPSGGAWRAAMHLKALLDGEALTRALLGVTNEFDLKEIRELAYGGCDVFCRAYFHKDHSATKGRS